MKVRTFSLLAVGILVLFTGITLVGPFSAVRKQLATVGNHVDVRPHLFSMIFDAGSTGTRLHVFTFINDTDGQLLFDSEQYYHTEPGLSHYVDDPKKAATSIVPLLKEAQKIIPAKKWHKTPAALKATAGLRLLPEHAADAILQEVHNLLSHSPFVITNESVTVMDGIDEGVYAWHTVNYLLGFLGDTTYSVATLDLGGGSNQVTFAPSHIDTFAYSPPSHLVKRKLLDQTLYLYTHSYLGLGLMSARQAVILSTTYDPTIDENNIVEVTSPCFPSNMQHNWYHSGQEYSIIGMGLSHTRFDDCLEQAKFVVIGNTHIPRELNKRGIYLLSYYFDRAADARLVDRHKGGVLKVSDYLKAARSVCEKNSPEKPFLCLDLCYIASLLHDGFGLDWSKELTLVKKINGVESSWALGAAFDLMS